MSGKEKKLLLIYLAVMLVLIMLSRLYWIFGDDPIGLLLVFFYLAPGISFVFALVLGNNGPFWRFPVIAGGANVLNYMCNSMMRFKPEPDIGTLWVFAFASAAALAGVLLIQIIHRLSSKKS